jgi:GTPase SAR1 family protein
MEKRNSLRESRDVIHRFLVIGDAHCGKSSIINHFCSPEDIGQRVSQTIGIDVHVKEIQKEVEGRVVYEYIEFWEVSGGIKQSALLETYLQAISKEIDSLKGAIFCFDASNIKTLFNVSKYLEELVSKVFLQKLGQSEQSGERAGIPLFLLGTKADLLEEKMQINKIAIIEEYMRGTFDENPKLLSSLVSIKNSFDQFEGLTNFLTDCANGDRSKLYLFSPYIGRRKNSYDRISDYTKEKLNLLSKDFERVKHYFSLRKIDIYTFMKMWPLVIKKDNNHITQTRI